MDNIITDLRNAIFLFPFYGYRNTCNILLCPKCYIDMYLMDMVDNFDFLNQIFLSKKLPLPSKTEAMASIYVKFKQSLFC